MKHSRRDFMRLGVMLGGGLSTGLFAPPLFVRRLQAADPNNERKLIFIFQRGGNDGLNTVIPRGDPDYSTDNRPSLFIPEDQAIDTGNGFAQLHPRLQPLMELYNHSSLNGQEGPGNLAVLHRVGYAGQSRSHFDSQQYWENAVPGNTKLEEGFLFRHLDSTRDLASRENAFVAAGISSSQVLSLKGAKPIPNFSRASTFSFLGSRAKARKFLGHLPSTSTSIDGKALLGAYGGQPEFPDKPYRALVHDTGQLLGAAIETLQGAVDEGPYTPSNGAVYPDGSFGRKLREAAMLLKRTPIKIVGLNLGGWDTHSRQGGTNGEHGDLLYSLAQGFQALHRDLQDQWDRLLVMTMTEFGRTSLENGGRGTDHAEASTMLVGGGGVKGGVYNCDADAWKPGDMFSKKERYLARRTDFRAIFGEILTRHLGDDPALLDTIMPGYNAAAAENPADFRSLAFLNG